MGRAVPPSRKDAPDDATNMELVAVEHSADFGDMPAAQAEPTAYRTIGFDLDRFCTSADVPVQACTPPAGTQPAPDGPRGIDNTFGFVVQKFREFVTQFSSDIYTSQLVQGAPAVALRLRNYNGAMDDPTVEAALFATAPFDTLSPGISPAWNGNDVFPISDQSVNDGSLQMPKNVDAQAYVTGGQLVANFDSLDLPFVLRFTNSWSISLSLRLQAATLACTMPRNSIDIPPYNEFTCTLTGRWLANDLLSQVPAIPDPIDLQHPHPLCPDAPAYPSFKSYICTSADLGPASSSGPTPACDSLSFGMKLSLSAAKLGDVVKTDTTIPSCPPFDGGSITCDSM